MRKKGALPCFVLVIGLLFFSDVAAVRAAALSVEPIITKISMIPGQRWDGTVMVRNPNPEPVRVRVGTVNLISGTGDGDAPIPLVNEAEDARAVSLAGWIATPPAVTVAGQSEARVPVSITIPPYAGHGLHRAAVTVTQEGVRPDDGGAQVASSIAAGFAVTVHGENVSDHDLQLSRFIAGSFVVSTFPVSMNVRIENHGTTLGVLDGKVAVRSLLGLGGTTFEVADPQEGRYLLPGKAYENTFKLSDAALGSRFGLYRADISIENGGAVLGKSAYFAVVPLPVALLFFGALVVSAIIVRWAVRKRPETSNS